MAIYVSGFDFGTTEDQIGDHFEGIARVSDVRLVGSGGAVVRFDDPGAADRAVGEMNGSTISGNRRYINVKIDGDRSGGKKGGKGDGKGFGGDFGGGGGKGKGGGKRFDDFQPQYD